MTILLPADILIELRFIVASLVALGGAIACFAYVVTRQRRRAKKPTYLAAGFGFVYMGVVYFLGAVGIQSYLLRSGWLTILGLIYLAGVYIANVIADWRVEK